MKYINGWTIYPCEGGFKGAKDCGKNEFGVRKRKTFRGKTEKEVKEKIDKYEFEVATGLYVEPNKDTLVNYLKEYHRICAGYDMWNPKSKRPDEAKWEETTAELYKMYIDVHIEPYFKDMLLKDVKPITLDKFYNYKMSAVRQYEVKQGKNTVIKTREPLSINTVVKLHKFLKAAFHYAVTNEKIKKNPTDGVQLKKPIDYIPNVYSTEQFLKLLSFVSGKDEEIPIVLGAGCGFRRSEICGLRWKDIDFKNGTISVEKAYVRFNENIEKNPKTKTSKRKIVAPAYVIDTLKRYRQMVKPKSGDDKVITRWKPQSLSERFTTLLEQFGLPHIRLHDLRHYNATIMMSLGIPDKQAAARLGHSNLQTLRKTYQHILTGMDEDAANKINSTFTAEENDKIIKFQAIQ